MSLLASTIPARATLHEPDAGAAQDRLLLGVSEIDSGAAVHEFVVPAHALCAVTHIERGRLWMQVAGPAWSPLPSRFGMGPQTRAQRFRAEPCTKIVTGLFHGRVLALLFGRLAASFRDLPLSVAELEAFEGPVLGTPFTRASRLWRTGQDGVAGTRSMARDSETARRLLRALSTETSVAHACRLLGLPERALQRLCDWHFGLAPSMLTRLARLHRCAAGTMADAVPLAVAALDAGYCDQPHMVRDFTRLAGIRPSRLGNADAWALRQGALQVAPRYFATP